MRDHPSAVAVRQFYEALARDDRTGLEALCAPALSLQVGGSHRLSGHFVGRSGALEWFRRAAGSCAAGFSLTPLSIAAIGGLAVAVEHLYATATHGVLSVDSVRVFHLAGGVIQRVQAIDLDSPAVASFWGSDSDSASSLQVTPGTVNRITPSASPTPGREA